MVVAFAIGTGIAMKLLAATGLPSAIAFVIGLVVGIAAGYGAGKLISLGLGAFGGRFGHWWNSFIVGHWNARLHDHRLVMVGAGFGALALSIGLFATLPMTFQPPLNLDFSQVNVTLPPGSTLEQTTAVEDRVSQILKRDPDVEHVFERINVAEGHLNIVLKKKRSRTSTNSSARTLPNWRRSRMRG